MNIKIPAVYDIAGSYETVADWSALDPFPVLVIHKATEGNYYQDSKCKSSLAGMAANGIARGVYHFFRKAISSNTQAQYFCDFIRGSITKNDLLVLDVEEGGETASQLWGWTVYVQSQFPSNQIMIYSRANVLNLIPMTNSQKDYFKQIPIWTAGYPANPDLYAAPPADYIPDQTRWGVVWLWQYSDKGIVTGVTGAVDVNWISPVLLALIGSPPPVEEDVITYPYTGVQRISGTRYGWKFELFITNPSEVSYEAVCLSPLETVSSVTARKGAQIAVNGGEWDRVKLTDYSVSNGYVCQARVQAVPSLMVLADDSIVIDHRTTANVTQALSGVRYLIQNRVIKAYLYDPNDPLYDPATATEGHARSIHGKNAAGYHMVLQSEGVYPNQGLRLVEAAEIMKQYGAVTAFDSGGGGDVTCIMDGVSLIVPENVYNGVHFERALPQAFLIYAEEFNMANGTAKEKNGNTSTIRKTPSRYGDTMGTIAPYSTIEFVAVVPVVPEGTADNSNDTWLKLPSGYYVNHVLAGVTYYTILTQPTEPPPTGAKPASIDMTLTTGSVVTIKDAAGNVLWSGTA